MTVQELESTLALFENVCYSGGAAGADRLFGMYAYGHGFDEIHLSFDKHKSSVPESTILEIPSTILKSKEIQKYLRTANISIGRKIPYVGSYVYNLLARNYFQIAVTERVYTIGELESPSMLKGGTSWATQMYINRTDNEGSKEIYHFNMSDSLVYSYDNNLKEFVQVQSVPAPYGRWTGIGSRKATPEHLATFEQYFTVL